MAISNIHKILASIALAIGMSIGAYQIYIAPPPPVFVCQFKNMTDKFETTRSEAVGNSYMVMVNKGGRVFMFRRDNLTACYVKFEDVETPQD